MNALLFFQGSAFFFEKMWKRKRIDVAIFCRLYTFDLAHVSARSSTGSG
jgi:hypothetical protein